MALGRGGAGGWAKEERSAHICLLVEQSIQRVSARGEADWAAAAPTALVVTVGGQGPSGQPHAPLPNGEGLCGCVRVRHREGWSAARGCTHVCARARVCAFARALGSCVNGMAANALGPCSLGLLAEERARRAAPTPMHLSRKCIRPSTTTHPHTHHARGPTTLSRSPSPTPPPALRPWASIRVKYSCSAHGEPCGCPCGSYSTNSTTTTP